MCVHSVLLRSRSNDHDHVSPLREEFIFFCGSFIQHTAHRRQAFIRFPYRCRSTLLIPRAITSVVISRTSVRVLAWIIPRDSTGYGQYGHAPYILAWLGIDYWSFSRPHECPHDTYHGTAVSVSYIVLERLPAHSIVDGGILVFITFSVDVLAAQNGFELTVRRWTCIVCVFITHAKWYNTIFMVDALLRVSKNFGWL